MTQALSLGGRRVLVTGGAGFIGSNFVHRLLALHPGVHVVVLDALTYAGRRENLDGVPAASLTFVHGDIRDPKAVATAMAGCDLVGQFTVYCGGHRLNAELVRTLLARWQLVTGLRKTA